MGTTKQKRLDLAFAALLSEDDAQVLTALTRIGEEGDARAIRPLLNALANSKSVGVQQRITALLNEVKAEGATAELLAALDDPALLDIRPTVIAAFWNAGLDVREHLERFITLAVEGDATECFECLTVIENQEIWPEKAVRLGLARVRKAAASEADAYKAAMLGDLAAALAFRLGEE